MTVEPTPTLTRDEAHRLTQRIQLVATNAREALEKLSVLVEQARAGGAHAALGFASWTDYLSSTLGSSPMRLDREQRRELVAYLAGEGMSTRAIAPIVGAGASTVKRDLATGPSGPVARPSTVTSLDGRQRPSTQPKPAPSRAAEAVESYPELQHYRDKGDDRKAEQIADALDGMDDHERDRRREALAGAIAADKRGDLDTTPDPREALHEAADRIFRTANATTRALRSGGIRAVTDAVPHEDPVVLNLWRDEFADLAHLCQELSVACGQRGLRVVR